jgi:TRAP-type mannitol/chloroaromatic compound transport system substrate-binding protein
MERRKFLKGAAIAGTGAALAAPAIAQGTKEMNIVSTWPRDFPGLGTSAQRLAKNIEILSQGSIKVNYFAAGERVKAFDSFDEVASGNSQAYIAADYYWIGKEPAFAYYTTVPFGMTVDEWNAWVLWGGGQELWDKVSGQFGLKALPCGATGTQGGGWFNKEINSPEDFKGLKMRIPGLGGTVMSKLGVSTISLPGGQIYENLVSGAIDATEWVGPFNDYFMKFYEVTKYYYTAGMHEPNANIALGMNASWWGSLTEGEQAVIRAAALMENDLMFAEYSAKNGEYLKKLIEEQGVVVKSYSDEIWDAFGEAAAEVFEETRAKSALAAEVDDAFQKALREIGKSLALTQGTFVSQRNRVLGLDV